MNLKDAYEKIVAGTKLYFKDAGISKAVLGMSGGVDSTLAAYVLKDALQGKNVTALLLPETAASDNTNVNDAKEVCRKLKINFKLIEISDFLKALKKIPWKQGKIAKGNSIARLRMNILYNFANSQNALVAGTGNKTELLLGYFTKYGDGGVDVLPIGNLYKTQVIELAKFLKLPESIVEKKPTAGLWHGQTDEGEIGMKYAEMDSILKALIDKKNEISLVKKEFGSKNVEIILGRMENAKHKLCLAKVLEI